METLLTILSGTTVFVLGQLVLKLVIEPVQEFRRTVSDIALALIEYANIYANPGTASIDIAKKASEELRKLASRLNAQVYLIPLYGLTRVLFRLPSQIEVTDAAQNLIGVSNGIFGSMTELPTINTSRADKIRKLLGIFVSSNQ